MEGLVSRASMIRFSLHPLPASEASAFNKIRAFSTRRAGLFPFRISVSSRWPSSPILQNLIFGTHRMQEKAEQGNWPTVPDLGQAKWDTFERKDQRKKAAD